MIALIPWGASPGRAAGVARPGLVLAAREGATGLAPLTRGAFLCEQSQAPSCAASMTVNSSLRDATPMVLLAELSRDNGGPCSRTAAI